ncbi:MAG: TonB-dependent receptor [Ignavibacteriales bacterium]|nr:TonB-dependent receptor [Ignavibacteriales bacterium]
MKKNLFVCLVLISVLPALMLAGSTGKIAGTVRDAGTGDLLPGCNILIEGTTAGATSDPNGKFYILNISPGKYILRAVLVGYRTYKLTNVEVRVDLTTTANFSLESSAVEMGETVVVAERPLIQKDITSKLSMMSSEELVNMPVENVQDVLATKAGFTTDADGNIHVRGGRTGEIAYMIDGMYVSDPLNGGFNAEMNKDAVQELMIVSGTFNAEYGEAMSSIVNIVTKEGGESYHGKVEYTTPMLNQSTYRKANAFTGVKDIYPYVPKSVIDPFSFDPSKLEIPMLGALNASLNGPVPFVPGFSFFVSGKYKNEDSYLPHGYSLERDVSNRLALLATHTVSGSLFYTAQFSLFTYNYKVQVGNKQPQDYARGQLGETAYFYVRGDDSPYTDDQTTTMSGKADATFQLNDAHQLKGGFEIKSHRIQTHEESEPWPSGAQYKDEYVRTPIEIAAYAQDKIEYDYLILNLGLRFDYADPRASMWPDIRRFGSFDQNNNWIPSPELSVPAKTQLSPRIGLAHPVTDRAVLHFSYGHFFQNPNYNALYYNHNKDLSSSMPLVGNPAIKAQKTVAYETGLKYKLSDDWVLEMSGWYKDITDLLSTLQVTYLSQDYVVFYNSDYASVKGIDFTLNKRYSDYFSGSFNYTMMVAKGNNSQPLGGYQSAYSKEEIPHQEYYLDFDQSHDFSVNLNLNIPKGKGPSIFGVLPLSDFNLNVLLQAGSGLPYTPYVDPSVRIDLNSARKPWTSTVDLRMIRKFWFSEIAASLFVEVTNLLNTENVRNVYSRSGKPFDTGLSGYVGSSPDADHNPANLGPPRIVKAGVQILW